MLRVLCVAWIRYTRKCFDHKFILENFVVYDIHNDFHDIVNGGVVVKSEKKMTIKMSDD